MINCDWMVCMHLYDIYVCMERMINGRTEVRIFLLSVDLIRPMLILLNYRLKLLESRRYTHWRILVPCRRPHFTQILTIPYVTLIIIHIGWIKYLSNSFYSTRIQKMLKCPYVTSHFWIIMVYIHLNLFWNIMSVN